MEIKIGVKQSPREIVLESNEEAAALTARIEEAVASESLLTITDAKGRTVLVPTSALGYVELGTETSRRVGFGAD